MVHGRRTNRPAVCGGPCAAAVLLLLAVTLLHAVLALGVVRDSPSTGPDQCAAGPPNPASVRGLAASAPAGAPVVAAPVPPGPETEDERSTASASAKLFTRDGAGHPARHAGRVVHGASFGAHRSLSTSLGPLALVAVRGRAADPATGSGAFAAGGDLPAGLLSSRSVVLRC
ncbi:hypothetical protein SSPO_014230 [Streptomyces antimycoticus]|uniref:Uncharacterized protein n=1 Tax=Streptomyces antimycoticus TaxID=68175 RepID=A0A499UC13_9ACTN|nr:hypothetical protein [Streptomyces antimycoticus]BBJ38705.1 hypothetical protein SSPO_014230 [Streptomyces antimycoticus]